MKKSSTWLMIAGLVIITAGVIIFSNLVNSNAVDSHVWTVNLNGLRSFPWLTFTGFVVFMIGLVFNVANRGQRNMHEHL